MKKLRRLTRSLHRVGFLVPLLALTVMSASAPSPALASNEPAWHLVQLVNAERARHGLKPLTINYALMDSAQSYAYVLAQGWCWGHYCGPVPNPSDRAWQAGYRGPYFVGENIAYGVQTPDAVFDLWMNSSAHRANILNPYWTEIGVGVAWDSSTTHWTQAFGAGRVAPPPRLLPVLFSLPGLPGT